MSPVSLDEAGSAEVRDLLGRALEGVPAPTGCGTGEVLARARRVRMRRRAAVTGVVASVAAVGVAFGSGVWTGGAEKAVEQAQHPSKAGEFKKLLPSDVGRIREVDPVRMSGLRSDGILGAEAKQRALREGGYDGTYAVYKDGGVGYLSVLRRSGPKEDVWNHPCGPTPGSGVTGRCSYERLPNGDVLEFRQDWINGPFIDNKLQTWGSHLVARLHLKGGGTLEIGDMSGFKGPYGLGPMLESPPLSKSQLRELALKPQLLEKKRR
ncbi:hypothetical protein OG407_34110 [Streptomyces sp. NBC_01515]|uniref:hypothetical protein n=1 Tax=Streptomyces sp. NBC_01515 TaxID=2903890 RepID=UPI00386581F4